MQKLSIKPTHKAIKTYYEALARFDAIDISNELAVKTAFQQLLQSYCSKLDWTLVSEWGIKRPRGGQISVDGALVDRFKLTHGFWEAKDTHDDLVKEVGKKFAAGYPRGNILFQAPDRAILYQDKSLIFDKDITSSEDLVKILKAFFEYQPPEYEQWEQAVAEFKVKVPEIAQGLVELIKTEQKSNKKFIRAFAEFVELCRQAINPNIAQEAVVEMLIQHLLTERIFRKVFDNPDFANRNIIACEIEKVIEALTSRSFSRHDWLKNLDPFYGAIEKAASTIDDFSQKQHFLNTVYQEFFQGFSVKVADTHGIVYTPPEIVNFMVNSVEDILKKEFGKSLSHKNVHILDPFVGTGNFIVHIMQKIRKTALERKYKNELHCNEVLLLPYYIASMNIEHEYFERTGGYDPYTGICMVDTFETAEQQIALFNDENTARVERQRGSPIFVIIGNPPYNQKQVNENDNNKNRKYKIVDGRVRETYAKDSKATNKNPLSDVYVKAIRWASDRVGDEGIVAYVSNHSFINEVAFDGMRAHLDRDFDAVYLLDLGGNVRKNPKLSGTKHNVFGIQVGVSINLFVKRANGSSSGGCEIHYFRTDEFWRKEEKWHFLDDRIHRGGIEWQIIKPNEENTWLTEGLHDEFGSFVPIGSKETKSGVASESRSIFHSFSNGVKTNRDAWAYNFDHAALESNMKRSIETYNVQVDKWARHKDKADKIERQELDDFVDSDEKKISWSEGLKNSLARGTLSAFDHARMRNSLFRPFTSSTLYFDRHFNERRYQFPHIYPTPETEEENRVVCMSGIGSSKPFHTLMLSNIPCLDMLEKTQCFPYYTYAEDGTNRRENITDWALAQFQKRYKAKKITKWDIFYYVYGILSHPVYGSHYEANLRRELPRIPFAPKFWDFSEAGRKLADLHVNYEDQPEYPLDRLETEGVPLNWCVEKMKLSKDKSRLIYNEFLSLDGIPPEAFEYRLGNRSALDWIIDQYRVKTDKRSGIVNDPNRADDEQYIVRLIGKVITVSIETVKILKSLPDLGIPE